MYTGSCSCGAVKVEIQVDPVMVGICHCHNCQKASGTVYSLNWVIPRSTFKVVEGKPTTFEVMGGSGTPALRQFCATCSSTMWTETSRMPDIVVIKAGILDDGAMAKFKPGAEAFTSRKPCWLQEIEGAKQFEEAWKAE